MSSAPAVLSPEDVFAKDILSAATDCVATRISEFAAQIASLPELQQKNVTPQQIVELWNANSDMKIVYKEPKVPKARAAKTAAPAASAASADSNVVAVPLAVPPVGALCSRKLKTGANQGKECGKAAKVSTPEGHFCKIHAPK